MTTTEPLTPCYVNTLLKSPPENKPPVLCAGGIVASPASD